MIYFDIGERLGREDRITHCSIGVGVHLRGDIATAQSSKRKALLPTHPTEREPPSMRNPSSGTESEPRTSHSSPAGVACGNSFNETSASPPIRTPHLYAPTHLVVAFCSKIGAHNRARRH